MSKHTKIQKKNDKYYKGVLMEEHFDWEETFGLLIDEQSINMNEIQEQVENMLTILLDIEK